MAGSNRGLALMSLLLIPIGIAINFVGGTIASQLKLPIFLDSIGTVLAALLGGPIVGAVTGFLGVMSLSAFNPAAVVWSLQAAVIGLVAGLLARLGWFRGIGRIIASTGIIILLSVALSATISYLVFGGFDGYGISVVRAALVESGMPLTVAIVVTSAVAELIDKSISVAIPLIVIGLMSVRFLHRFANGPHLRDAPETAPSRLWTAPGDPPGSVRPDRSVGERDTPGGYGSYDEPRDR